MPVLLGFHLPRPNRDHALLVLLPSMVFTRGPVRRGRAGKCGCPVEPSAGGGGGSVTPGRGPSPCLLVGLGEQTPPSVTAPHAAPAGLCGVPRSTAGLGTCVLLKAGGFCVEAAGALAQAPGYLILGLRESLGRGWWGRSSLPPLPLPWGPQSPHTPAQTGQELGPPWPGNGAWLLAC